MDDLSSCSTVTDSRVLTSPSTIVELFISTPISVWFFFMHFGALLVGDYVSLIVIFPDALTLLSLLNAPRYLW